MGIYRNGSCKNYYYSFQHKGKRYQGSTGTKVSDEAFQIYIDKKHAVTKNKLRFVGKTYRDLVEYFLDSYHKNDQAILIWSLEYFGDEKLEDLTGPDFKAIQRLRSLEVKASTVNRQFSVIKAILNKAVVDLGWLDKAPLWSKESEIKPIAKVLSAEEEERLLRELPSHLARVVKFALETGLRKSTIMGLTMDMYDNENRILRIPARLQKNRRELIIRVNQVAHELIIDEEGFSRGKFGLRLTQPERYIFTYQYKPFREPAGSAFRKAKKRARVEIKFHELRHTWATRRIQEGMPISLVAYLGGWQSSRMLEKYVHLSVESLNGLEKYGY